MKIKYEFVTDQAVELEVEGKLAEEIIRIEKEIALSDRRETCRHECYSDDNDKIETLTDFSTDIESEVMQNIDSQNLYDAMHQLSEQQLELIRKVFFENQSVASIALEENVGESAIRDRLNRIYKKLKKFLN